MATKRKSSGRSGESGSTLYGALAGLLIGLIVAAVVAFYVTRRRCPSWTAPAATPASCQTRARHRIPTRLYGRDGAAGTPPSGPTATTPAPLPGTGTAGADTPPSKSDDLGALIATLPTSNNKPAAAAVAPTPAAPNPLPTPIAKVAPTPAPAPKASAPAASASASASSNGSYYLQAGAFRSADDAESLKARIILLGLPVSVQKAEVNGKALNRVRVGPYARLDDMNRARGRLGENKIETAVVRQ